MFYALLRLKSGLVTVERGMLCEARQYGPLNGGMCVILKMQHKYQKRSTLNVRKTIGV